MKTLKSLTTVLLVFVILKPSVFAQQWDGDQNTTGSIFRMGKVGIGNNNPGGVLDIADPDGLSISGLPYSGQLRVFGKICPQIDLIDKDHKDWSIRANGDCLFFYGESRKSSLTIQQSGKVGIGIDKPISKLDICGDGTHWSQGFLILRNRNNDAGIRLYNDTDVKYHIYNAVSLDNLFRIAPEGNFNGGISINQDGNVGIGTPNPTEKLTVNGNILAENYTYKTTKNGYRGVAGSVFIPYAEMSVQWVPSEDGYGYLIADPRIPTEPMRQCNGNCYSHVVPITGHIELRTNVVLPDNAKVISFKCYWYDENLDQVAHFEFKLMRKRWASVTATTMATVEGSTNDSAPNNIRSTTTTSINHPIINTEDRSYYIIGTWTVTHTGDELRFYGCRIEYEITQAGSL